jgi:hypothetical protein
MLIKLQSLLKKRDGEARELRLEVERLQMELASCQVRL